MSTIVQLLVSGIMLGGIYALMSIGLTLIFGVLKIVNFAHGEFLMLAMYVAWAIVSATGITTYTAMAVVTPLLFGFGLLVYLLIVRPGIAKPHLVVVFATMGLSLVAIDRRSPRRAALVWRHSDQIRATLFPSRAAGRLLDQHRYHTGFDDLREAHLYRESHPRHGAGS
jgi:hypothetical protein